MRKTLLLWLVLTFAWSESILAQTGEDATEFLYAVTLLSSFDPIPDSMLPRDIPDHIYRTQMSVFGRSIYFVRLGFYATAGEADVVKSRMQARYPVALVTRITPDEYLKVTGGKPRTPVAAVLPKPVPAPLPAASPVASTPIPAAPAVPVLAPVVPTPPLVATPGVPTPPPEAAIPPASGTAPQAATAPAPAIKPATALEQEAGTLMEQTRDALMRGDNAAAIQLLGKLLRLLPNSHSQDAQELIGLAHERQREIAAAKQEYNLYLRLYPEGSGADRVRQRLAVLETPVTPAALKKPERKEASVASTYGSLSQYYYYGQSQIDSSTTVLGPASNTSLTSNDQSALYNNLDLRARYSSGNWDNRVVLRDSYTASFLDNVDSYNRLYSAYYEAINKAYEFSGRFGRQPGTNGGVLGRFDGVTLGYNVLPKWRVNVVAGTPVEFYSVNYSKQFWGTSVDFGLFADHWNGSVYYIQQTVDGIADRQAVGTELRYFDPRGSALLYVDYDTLFGELNIATFQATWLSSPTTTWNTLIDHRRAPTLMASNALFDTTLGSTIPTLLNTLTEEELRQQAIDNTPIFDTYMLGVSHNLNTTWQIGGDVRRFSLSALPTSPTVTTTLGTGATMMYTVQTIGNGLFRQRDLSVLSLSYLDGETYQGETLAITHRMLFQDSWTLDLALSYSLQQGNPLESIVGTDTHTIQTDSNRLAPMVRIGYRWRKNVIFETEFGIEKSASHVVDTNKTAGGTAVTDQDTSRRYLMLGYRWEF